MLHWNQMQIDPEQPIYVVCFAQNGLYLPNDPENPEADIIIAKAMITALQLSKDEPGRILSMKLTYIDPQYSIPNPPLFATRDTVYFGRTEQDAFLALNKER